VGYQDELQVGRAFDVVAERKQLDYKVLSSALYETEWEKESAMSVLFSVPVRPDEEVVVTYRVRTRY